MSDEDEYARVAAVTSTITDRRTAADLSRAAVDLGNTDDDPSVPSAAYERMRVRWEKTRACFIGTEAIRAGGEEFLVRYAAESDDRYEARRNLAAFYNGYARTVTASVGMLLAVEPDFDADMPQELVDLAENIDAAGMALTPFAAKLFTASINDSFAGIFVDFQRANDPKLNRAKASAASEIPGAPLDASDESALGLRPFFLLYRADDVIKAVYETVGGVKTLTLLILRATVSRRKGRFGLETITQYHIYENASGVISYSLWEATAGQARPTPKEGPLPITNQTKIPWSPMVSGDEIAPGEYKPALSDLADLNIQYHNTLTNRLSIEALACVPTPVRVGATPNDGVYPELLLGPENTIEAPATEGVSEPVYWLSPPVDVTAASDKTLAATKADMGSMGAAFLSSETRAAETAEGKRMDSAASRASLLKASRAGKDCLEGAFGFAANYLKTKAGSIKLNEDFTMEGIDPMLMAQITAAYQAGGISIEEYRTFLATGQLPETFDPEDTKAVLAQNSARDPANTDPTNGGTTDTADAAAGA